MYVVCMKTTIEITIAKTGHGFELWSYDGVRMNIALAWDSCTTITTVEGMFAKLAQLQAAYGWDVVGIRVKA